MIKRIPNNYSKNNEKKKTRIRDISKIALQVACMILRNHFRSSHERKGKGKNWDRLKFSLEHDGKKKGEKKKRKGSLERFLLDIDSLAFDL